MVKKIKRKRRTRALDFGDKRKYNRLDNKRYNRKKILRRAKNKRRMNRGLVGFRGMFG